MCEGFTKSVNESRLEIEVHTEDGGTSIIFLRGWESVETLRGQAFDFLVIDEVASMRDFWMEWQEVLRPTLTDRRGEVLFISTPAGFNHFYDLYNLEATDKDFKSFHFTSYDNPYVPMDELDTARKQLTEDRFAQEYLADFRKTEGLVYKEFSRKKCLFDDTAYIPKYETLAGVDFGFNHPAAVIEVTVDMEGIYWVTNEWYHSGKVEDEVCDYVATQEFNKVYPDPENASAIESLRRKGVNIRDVKKGAGSVISGISVVRELFKSNRLKIHKKCVNLINELETYSYRDSNDFSGARADELPIKEHDDAVDSLRYCLMTYEATRGQNKANIYIPNNYINASHNSAIIKAQNTSKVFIPNFRQRRPN